MLTRGRSALIMYSDPFPLYTPHMIRVMLWPQSDIMPTAVFAPIKGK